MRAVGMLSGVTRAGWLFCLLLAAVGGLQPGVSADSPNPKFHLISEGLASDNGYFNSPLKSPEAEFIPHSRSRRSVVQYHYVSQPRVSRYTYVKVYQKVPPPEPKPLFRRPSMSAAMFSTHHHLRTEHSRHSSEEHRHEEEQELHEDETILQDQEIVEGGSTILRRGIEQQPSTNTLMSSSKSGQYSSQVSTKTTKTSSEDISETKQSKAETSIIGHNVNLNPQPSKTPDLSSSSSGIGGWDNNFRLNSSEIYLLPVADLLLIPGNDLTVFQDVKSQNESANLQISDVIYDELILSPIYNEVDLFMIPVITGNDTLLLDDTANSFHDANNSIICGSIKQSC